MPKGGKQPGAGRPKGKKNKATLEKEAVLNAMKERVMGMADKLIDAQASLAQGLTFLYVIKKDDKGKKQKPEIVSDPEMIARHLNGELEDSENEFYYISTKEPNNQAIDSLLNRTFGKPVESVELSGKDGNALNVAWFMPEPHGSEE